MTKFGSYLIAAFSLLVTAAAVVVTAIGWTRILFYTGWVSQGFSYPAAALFYIALFGLTLVRVSTMGRASLATLIATGLALLAWVLATAFDRFYGGTMVACLTEYFGMTSLIVEEEELNSMGVLCGIAWPTLYTVILFFVAGLMGPQKVGYRRF